jgi:hypothetical protein
MSVSGSRSDTSTRSSSLWIVALTGPSSTTSGQMSAMKRPSDVPPVHDSSGTRPVTSRIALVAASTSRPRRVRNGLPHPVHRISCSMPCLRTMSANRCMSDSRVLSGAWRKLNVTSSVPGITFVAPVPAWMFEHWKDVGGKYSLPLSHLVCARSASTGAARWMGLRARCGYAM